MINKSHKVIDSRVIVRKFAMTIRKLRLTDDRYWFYRDLYKLWGLNENTYETNGPC